MIPSSAATFHRPENVVWRLAPDRVLVRRVGDLTDDACADLIGLAAAVWVGLDEAASLTELRARLADADIVTTETDDASDTTYVDALAALVERGWIDLVDDRPDPRRPTQSASADGAHER